MDKFEYKRLHTFSLKCDEIDKNISSLGLEGWELVAIEPESFVYIFKRRIHDFS